MATPAQAKAPSPWKRHENVVLRADSLYRAGGVPAGLAYLDSLLATPSAHEDRGLRSVAMLTRARGLLLGMRSDEAERSVEQALPVIHATRDTASWCRAIRLFGSIDESRGLAAAAERRYRESLALARRAGLAGEEGRSLMAIANLAMAAERASEAAATYRRALRRLERSDDDRIRMAARAALARALQRAGDAEGARREQGIVLAEAERLSDRAQQGDAHYNLGSFEWSSGDISRATAHFQRAMECYRAVGWPDRTVRTATALAILLVNSNMTGAADSILTGVLPEAERSAGLEARARLLCQLGVVRRQQARYREAAELGRRAVALADSGTGFDYVSLMVPLLTTLEEAGRIKEVLDLVEAKLAGPPSPLTPAVRGLLEYKRATTLRVLGRPREALATLRSAATSATGTRGSDGIDAIDLMQDLARCYGDLGQRDSAIIWYGRAADRWDVVRSGVSDPAWRERFDELSGRFSGEYAAVLLDPARGGTAAERARQAFEVLQQFRARTLTERLGGGGAPLKFAAGRVITAEEFARRTLLDGELLLDIHATPETTIVFAVTRDSILGHFAPGSLSLLPRLRRLRDLLDDPASGADVLRSGAAASLGNELLGPASGLIQGARRVLIAAGSLAQYPIGALALPGAAEPIMATKEVAITPSAGLLAASRVRPKARASRAVLAVARTRDAKGHEIPGAARETRWLAQRLAGVDVRVDDAEVAAVTRAVQAPGYQVLHFAAHTRTDPERPWRAAILVGRPEGPNPWLEASEIARLKVPTQLCVMAGCSSLGGQREVGETLAGLAAAWVVAGVPTVIATQWEVDDESTAELMHRFYARLARGETAAGALHGARLEVRAIEKFAHPYFWAGIVLLGDPDTRVVLEPRRGAIEIPGRPWSGARGQK